jgi:hypothetical protein
MVGYDAFVSFASAPFLGNDEYEQDDGDFSYSDEIDEDHIYSDEEDFSDQDYSEDEDEIGDENDDIESCSYGGYRLQGDQEDADMENESYPDEEQGQGQEISLPPVQQEQQPPTINQPDRIVPIVEPPVLIVVTQPQMSPNPEPKTPLIQIQTPPITPENLTSSLTHPRKRSLEPEALLPIEQTTPTQPSVFETGNVVPDQDKRPAKRRRTTDKGDVDAEGWGPVAKSVGRYTLAGVVGGVATFVALIWAAQ